MNTLLDEADFVIVGTGAGGATAARVLTAAGHSVVLLEEGRQLRAEERPRHLLGALGQSMRKAGAHTTAGVVPMPLLQGRCVGGSTAINSGIIWRMPERVRRDWVERFGLAELVDETALLGCYETIEDELSVVETQDEVLGGNGHLLAEASTRMGLAGRPTTRNAKRCEGRGECLQGCAIEARQSMDVSYIPRSIAAGARLHECARVTKIQIKAGHAIGVVGDRLERSDDLVTERVTGRFEVRARRGVIVAAGAVHTPIILQRSGLRGGPVGKRFQAHPGCAVVGRFDEPVDMSFGATQGYQIPMPERGYKVETLAMPPEMLATRLPGVGAEWQERLAHLNHFAQWAAVVRMEAHGTVTPGFGGRPVVRYNPTERDMRTAIDGVVLIANLMFEAGAREIYPGIHSVPPVLHNRSEIKLIEQTAPDQRNFHMVTSHLFGTACAGDDPARSVVGPDLQAHSVSGLYVMDASVFPTNLGVNPQHSIMAVVFRAAEQLANSEQRAA